MGSVFANRQNIGGVAFSFSVVVGDRRAIALIVARTYTAIVPLCGFRVVA